MGADIYDLTDQLPVLFQDQIQFRHKIRIRPVAMEHIMLHTPGPVYIPERLPGQVFYGTVFVLFFSANNDSHGTSLFLPIGFVCFCDLLEFFLFDGQIVPAHGCLPVFLQQLEIGAVPLLLQLSPLQSLP